MPGTTRAYFRRLFPWESDRYAAHLRTLTPQGRRWRFCGLLSDDALDDHAARALDTGHVEGCFLDGRLIGAFELFVDPHPPGHAQVALSVEPAHTGQGLGTEMIERARRRASLLGVPDIALMMQGDNAAMIAVARHAGASLVRAGPELGATLAVPPRDLRALPAALALDEASLVQSVTSAMLRAGRAAAARAMLAPAAMRRAGHEGGRATA
ncbi:GNAT family N-acetyltransferase [Paracoccus luteus]|uniref:GNAT family N-acetyltransferase n=1 Tax=Paracoccus luteus TaxID=2508543 RepID=UPI0010702EDE|nr:GNAT family N-acetyltransferase [Paracoccus luteus]